MYKSFKATFKMELPICFIDRPNFDGILIYCWMREKYGNTMVDLKLSGDQLSVFPGLPIPYGKEGFPMASVMCFDKSKSVEYTGSWKKRWDNQNDDLADFGKNKRTVSVSSGHFKSYNMPLNLWETPEVWFYFMSDNVQEVQRLILNELAGIGKKVGQGYGFYSRLEITESDRDFETELLRPVPIKSEYGKHMMKMIKEQDEYELIQRYCAWRPPYYLPENFTTCLYPSEKSLS